MTIAILTVVVCIFIMILIISHFFGDRISFYATGLDSKFSFQEITLLWKLAKIAELEVPSSLYYSLPALNRCISDIIENARKDGTEDYPETQDFLSKLYRFRTKIELESDKKRGLDSTKYLNKDQKLTIILPGKGVFNSKVVNSSRDLIITVPLQDGVVKVHAADWVGKEIHVYLWRKGDASYVFDSVATGSGMFLGYNVIHIKHSDELLRAQKRRSIRCQCHIMAQLYILREAEINYDEVETMPGYKCLIEDISEDGAMIRTGGKGVNNIQVKIQFQLEEKIIVMFGVIRAVEFNEVANQSRLHLEATHIEPAMKNEILSFVYKVIPETQKEKEQALAITEKEGEDEKKEAIPLSENPATPEPAAENDISSKNKETVGFNLMTELGEGFSLEELEANAPEL